MAEVAQASAATTMDRDAYVKRWGDFKESYITLLLQVEQCQKRGEERKVEIRRLRELLRSAGSTPNPGNAPGSQQPDNVDEPFTRQEARAVFKVVEDFMLHSAQYQRIIKALQKQQAACAEAKQRLRAQIDILTDQDAQAWSMTTEIARLTAENSRLQNAAPDHTTRLTQQITALTAARNDLQMRLVTAERDLRKTQIELNDCQNKAESPGCEQRIRDLSAWKDDLQRQLDESEMNLHTTREALTDALAANEQDKRDEGDEENGGDNGGDEGLSRGSIPPGTPPGNDAPSTGLPPINREVSEDTPPHTPGGTKRKARPGARLRRETRANKRRAAGWYSNHNFEVHEPASPPESPPKSPPD